MPIYGSKEKWGGDLAKKSTIIKDIDFKKKVKACPRIDRTLVYQRQHDIDIKSSRKQQKSPSDEDFFSIDINSMSHRDMSTGPPTGRGKGPNITPGRFKTIGDNISRL